MCCPGQARPLESGHLSRGPHWTHRATRSARRRSRWANVRWLRFRPRECATSTPPHADQQAGTAVDTCGRPEGRRLTLLSTVTEVTSSRPHRRPRSLDRATWAWRSALAPGVGRGRLRDVATFTNRIGVAPLAAPKGAVSEQLWTRVPLAGCLDRSATAASPLRALLRWVGALREALSGSALARFTHSPDQEGAPPVAERLPSTGSSPNHSEAERRPKATPVS